MSKFHIVTVESLASLFSLTSWDKLEDASFYYWSEGCPEDATEDEQYAYQDAQRLEVYNQWHSAVMLAANTMFEKFDLDLVPNHKKDKYPFEYRVIAKDWKKSADLIRETVNGVGYFHFNTLREFMSSGPFTARTATIAHLGYIASYSEVYGDYSAEYIYNRSFR